MDAAEGRRGRRGPRRCARAWQAIKRDKDGTFRHPALRGGYAFISIRSDGDAVMILEAAGHAMAYAGGEPRVGDPYSHGYVRVPIALKAGENPLLFAAGRGSLRLKLTRPRADAQIDPSDPTLPDLIAGRETKAWAAVVVANASPRTLEGATLRAEVDGATVATPLPAIPSLGLRKVPFRLEAPTAPGEGKRDLKLTLMLRGSEAPIDTTTFSLDVVAPVRAHRRTFVSAIDGSVQYFGLVPARAGGDRRPGLILTLHGASVEGIGQARVYKPKPWAHVVAPTNRRPYGFDWEEWGRLDAIEVLELATAQLDPDPRRVYLTGHSMGGHGAWHLGVTFPDRFAAIAPSAGWVSLSTYGGRGRPDAPADPVAAMVAQAQSPSDTLGLVSNLGPRGVYVLHGDRDDNVPVDQARTMRKALGDFHPDFAYYERPGAGHWWGDECCDWPPLLDFLARHELPASGEVRRIDFATASPGVSARRTGRSSRRKSSRSSGARSTSPPTRPPARSSGRPRTSPGLRSTSGCSRRAARSPSRSTATRFPASTARGPGSREGGHWKRIDRPSPALKGPDRSGPFRDAFRNRVRLVYGTRGTAEENAWALARARYDAETFWYRGNGSIDVVPDTAFDPRSEPDRNVVLYGHSESNAAWPALLGDGPVQVRRGSVRLGRESIEGDGLACLFVRPRAGSDRAVVGVVSGTGPAGMRRTDRLPYLTTSGAYPDLVILDGDGPVAAGFFGVDWGVDSGELARRKL